MGGGGGAKAGPASIRKLGVSGGAQSQGNLSLTNDWQCIRNVANFMGFFFYIVSSSGMGAFVKS